MSTRHIERLVLGFVLPLFIGCAANQALVTPVSVAPTPAPAPAPAPAPTPAPPPIPPPPGAIPVSFGADASEYFGKVAVGSSTFPVTLSLQNQNAFSVALSPLAIVGANPADFVIGSIGSETCGATLAANSVCGFTLAFAPTAGGTRTGTAQFLASTSPDEQVLQLSGFGTVGVTATPTFRPGAGTYTTAQSVTISTASPDATIYYTTNGYDPDILSPIYKGPIAVDVNQTIKAFAISGQQAQSGIGSATYILDLAASTPPLPPNLGTPQYIGDFTGGWIFDSGGDRPFLGTYFNSILTGALKSDSSGITGAFQINNDQGDCGYLYSPTPFTGTVDAQGEAHVTSGPVEYGPTSQKMISTVNFILMPTSPPTTYAATSEVIGTGPFPCADPVSPVNATRIPSLSGTYLGTQAIPVKLTILEGSEPSPDGTFPLQGRLSYTTGSCSVDVVLKGTIFGHTVDLEDGLTYSDSTVEVAGEYRFAPGPNQGISPNGPTLGVLEVDAKYCGAAEVNAEYAYKESRTETLILVRQ